jgi:hypothetical protein
MPGRVPAAARYARPGSSSPAETGGSNSPPTLLRFSSHASIVTKNTGVKNKPKNVTPNMPENTAIPIA